jgi:tetratricopeptide (TPR) repeat protein
MSHAYATPLGGHIDFGRIVSAVAGLAICAVLALPPTVCAAESDPLAESLRLLYGGDPMQAAALAEQYLKAHPDSAAGRVSLAQAKMAVGDFETAYAQLREAIRANPKHVEALYHFSKLCAILAQLEHQQLFSMAPEHYRVHQLMAESYLAQGDVAKAEQTYQAALKANPKSVTVLNALGDLKRFELGGAAEASLDPAAKSRFDEAAAYYSRALKLDPGSYEAHYGLGVSYLSSNKTAAATEHFRKAVRADPRSALAHLALGRALLTGEKSAEAVEELKMAVRLEPKLRQGFFLLGRAYQKLGKMDLAKQAMAMERELRQGEFRAAQEAISTGGMPAGGPQPPNPSNQR